MVSPIKRVGVVGAGVMGSQIADIMAYNGYETRTRHRTDESKKRALADIRKTLSDLVEFHAGRAEKEIKRIEQGGGFQLTEEQKKTLRERLKAAYTKEMMEEAMARIKPSLTLDDFKDVDFVVESVVEDIDVKKEIFKKLDEVCPSHTILASNTSTRLITEIASATKRPDRVIGLHFFNPPVAMPLIEVIPGLETGDETLNATMGFAKSLKNHRGPMQPIKVKEVPGFLVNRILMAMLKEAFALYEEEVASAREIDAAMKTGAGWPMGPFELADLIGMDVLYHMDESINRMQGGNTMPKPIQVLRKMYLSGRLGRKTKRGFYEYQ